MIVWGNGSVDLFSYNWSSNMKYLPIGVFPLFFLFAITAAIAGEIRVVDVHFKANETGTTIKGAIKGRETIDYRLKAKAGQLMTVSLNTSNLSNYFNVLPPGSETALFVGSTSGTSWTGVLPTDGDYTVRVYLMRSAARRNEKAKYTLSINIPGEGLGRAPASDAKVPGTPYHAMGPVPCSVGSPPKGSAQCEFGVIRGAPGNAEVHLTLPDGGTRVLIFKGAQVTSADPTVRLKASKSGYDWSVNINDIEFYEIPEAVINGG
jgi:hypothetical protein